jgi:drug/metabolite transporter (DMT)-like permease
VTTSAARPHHPVLGIACKLLSVLFLAGMAACVKYLGSDIPAGQTIFVRGIISCAALALIAAFTQGLHVLKTSNWKGHASRSLAGTLSMFCWFTALTLIPFADMTAISFTTPMFLTVLAIFFLGERIHVYRWSALVIGFIGVSIMVGPHLTFAQGSTLGAAVGLAASVFAAFALLFLRSMSGSEHAITITFYFSLTSMICAAFTAIAGWPMPTRPQWIAICLTGVFGVLGQLMLTFSYRYAEATTIAPLDYTSLLTAVLFGYYLFGEVPHVSIWLGAPLVIVAGLIILWREYQISLQRVR